MRLPAAWACCCCLGLARHPLAVAGGFVYTVELKGDGTPEVVKYRIDDSGAVRLSAPLGEGR